MQRLTDLYHTTLAATPGARPIVFDKGPSYNQFMFAPAGASMSLTMGVPTMTNHLFSRAGVRYEVALDVLGAIIAHHSEMIAAERDKAVPDEAAIAAAQKAKDELRALRDELDPNTAEAIERVIEQYGPQARDLYAQ